MLIPTIRTLLLRDLASLQQQLEAYPDEPMLLTRMGELSLALGRTDDARAYLERGITAHPEYPVPYAVLGELERRRDDCAAAVRAVDRGLAYAPESSKLRLVRGACRQRGGDLEGARTDLEAVLDANPEDSDASYLLGLVLVGLGQGNAAVERFRNQVRLTRDQPRAQAALLERDHVRLLADPALSGAGRAVHPGIVARLIAAHSPGALARAYARLWQALRPGIPI